MVLPETKPAERSKTMKKTYIVMKRYEDQLTRKVAGSDAYIEVEADNLEIGEQGGLTLRLSEVGVVLLMPAGRWETCIEKSVYDALPSSYQKEKERKDEWHVAYSEGIELGIFMMLNNSVLPSHIADIKAKMAKNASANIEARMAKNSPTKDT
jgi:hypothetical protein